MTDRARAQALVPLLAERLGELNLYESMLRRWQARINLVAPSTLETIWTRHFADSAQLLDHASDAKQWVDLGSGAGFPGLVLAILLKGRSGAEVHLIESDTRKAAFLREVSRETEAPAVVHGRRIEEVFANLPVPAAATSRALAASGVLLRIVDPWLISGTRGLFLVGRELTPPRGDPNVAIEVLPSRTGDGAILSVRRSQ